METPALFVTRRQLGSIFQKDTRTIARWLEDGLPVARKTRGKASRYDLAACVAWVIEREILAVTQQTDGVGLSPLLERALLDQTRREEIELRMQVKRGELVPAEDVAHDFAECAQATKARLRRIPNAVADRIQGAIARGPHAVKALLLTEIDEALHELTQRADQDAGAA